MPDTSDPTWTPTAASRALLRSKTYRDPIATAAGYTRLRIYAWHSANDFYARERGHPDCVSAARSFLAPIRMAEEAENVCHLTRA